MVRTTLLYDLSASRLLLSDLPLPSINLMMWQRARLIKLNYFCSHLRLTVMQHCPSCSSFGIGRASVSGCWTTVYNWESIFRIYLIQRELLSAQENKWLSCTNRCVSFLLLGQILMSNSSKNNNNNMATHFRWGAATNDHFHCRIITKPLNSWLEKSEKCWLLKCWFLTAQAHTSNCLFWPNPKIFYLQWNKRRT